MKSAELTAMSREDRKAIAIEMHELWCNTGKGKVKRQETKGPCLQHALNKDIEAKKIDQAAGKERAKAIEKLVPKELGIQHNAEMHDWYCSRKPAVEAAAGSALRAFCAGWAHHKATDKSEL